MFRAVDDGTAKALIARIRIEYRRSSDGVKFSTQKFYYIVAAAKILYSCDVMRNTGRDAQKLNPFPIPVPSCADVEQALGGSGQTREQP